MRGYNPHDVYVLRNDRFTPICQQQRCHSKKSPALPFVEMRRANNSSACFQAHTHDEFSFGIIDSGNATYHNQKQAEKIGTGVTVLINPGEPHACNPDRNEWSYRMLFVDTRWIGELQTETGYTSAIDYLPFQQLLKKDRYTRDRIDHLYHSLSLENNQLQAETCLINLLTDLIEPPNSVKNAETQRIEHVSRVREMLLDQPGENLSLSSISSETGLSRFQIIRAFKTQYGQTPHAYLLDYRIKRAKDFLQQGRALADVALELGFSDQAHFQRHFKKRVAVTPRQYQGFFASTN